jgi:uncharacterized protein YpmS
MSTNKDSNKELVMWKWITTLLTALAISNLGTALAFRISDEHIAKIASQSFSDASREKSMYATSGERRVQQLENELASIRKSLSRIEGKLNIPILPED